MLDRLLDVVAYIFWALFGVYTLTFFITTLLQHGFVRALVRLFSYRVLGPLLLTISVTLLSMALVFVEPNKVGVVVSIISPGGIRPQPLIPGLHWIVPVLEREEIYPIFWQTYTMSGTPNEGAKTGDDSIRARTSDGQEVRLDCSVIFRIKIEQSVVVHIDWQTRYIEDFVRPLVRSLVRTQVSQFTVKEVNSSARKDLEALLDRLLREEFSEKGLMLDSFLLRDITFTPEYAMAIEEKQIAMEDKERALHQADQVRNLAQGEADREREVAAGHADALKLEAQAKNEALTLIGEALKTDPGLLTYEYIQKLSPSIRAMLVPNNAPLILPLPEMLTADPLTATVPVTTTLDPTNMPSVQATPVPSVPVVPTPAAEPLSIDIP